MWYNEHVTNMSPNELAKQMVENATNAAIELFKDDKDAIKSFVIGWLQSDLSEILEMLPKSKYEQIVKIHKH